MPALALRDIIFLQFEYPSQENLAISTEELPWCHTSTLFTDKKYTYFYDKTLMVYKVFVFNSKLHMSLSYNLAINFN